ncbi:recombinase family protein [Frigoribacterium sp. PhB118]|uniref:recombinase family protein n=1 Tax=Frigoribacterium sp. PhB118 TaxID=2485175 RepID=UPI00351907B4
MRICVYLSRNARVSTSGQDLAAQRDGLVALGVDDQHVQVDQGLSDTTRARPGLREALAACRAGDLLVVVGPAVRSRLDAAPEVRLDAFDQCLDLLV